MKTKKTCFAALLAALAFSVYGCLIFSHGIGMEFATIPDGVYEGAGRGYRGAVYVQVFMEGGNIAAIEIIDSIEEPSVGGAAMEELLDLVIAHNTTNIDIISGATGSSRGFLEAVENAIFRHE